MCKSLLLIREMTDDHVLIEDGGGPVDISDDLESVLKNIGPHMRGRRLIVVDRNGERTEVNGDE